MLVLHGVYNNGKIKIEEKDLPKIKTKVEIRLPDIKKDRGFRSISRIQVDLSHFHFDRDEANAR
jgi:hypothetical protein